MQDWTNETALSQLDELISEVGKLGTQRRRSADHVRWVQNCLAFLGDRRVFGEEMSYCANLASLSWGETGAFLVEPEDWGRSMSLEDALDRKHQAAFRRDLEIAVGILNAAGDHIRRSGLPTKTRTSGKVAKTVGLCWKEFKTLPAPQLWLLVGVVVVLLLILSGLTVPQIIKMWKQVK